MITKKAKGCSSQEHARSGAREWLQQLGQQGAGWRGAAQGAGPHIPTGRPGHRARLPGVGRAKRAAAAWLCSGARLHQWEAVQTGAG